MPGDIGMAVLEFLDLGLGLLDPAFAKMPQTGLISCLDMGHPIPLTDRHNLDMVRDPCSDLFNALPNQGRVDSVDPINLR